MREKSRHSAVDIDIAFHKRDHVLLYFTYLKRYRQLVHERLSEYQIAEAEKGENAVCDLHAYRQGCVEVFNIFHITTLTLNL